MTDKDNEKGFKFPNAAAQTAADERRETRLIPDEEQLKAIADRVEEDSQPSDDMDAEFVDDLQQSFEETRIEPAPVPEPIKIKYFVSVVAPIKDVNIYQDGVVTMPHEVQTHEDVNLLRKAMADYLGVMPNRVAIVSFQAIDIEYV